MAEKVNHFSFWNGIKALLKILKSDWARGQKYVCYVFTFEQFLFNELLRHYKVLAKLKNPLGLPGSPREVWC